MNTPAVHMKKILLKVKQLTIYREEPCIKQGMKSFEKNLCSTVCDAGEISPSAFAVV